MTDRSESIELNRTMWDGRAPAHAASPDYAVARFADDPAFLSDVVRFDLPLLGDVSGLRGVHLQCHIGTDTVSLARLGARMTGLDFSEASVAEARKVAELAGADVDFVVSDVHEARAALGDEQFDLVFTGIGALCWLPDVDRWAGVVASLLRPGGRLFVREGHPMMWSIDEKVADRLVLGYPYFEHDEPEVFEGDDTYVETDQPLDHVASHSWNHSLGEIVTALTSRGFVVTGLVEHRSAPWDPLPGGRVVRGDDGEFRLREGADLLPMTYTLQALAPG